MKFLFCANCGKRLGIKRMAIPQHKTIVDCVEYHECSEKVHKYDFTEHKDFKPVEGKNRFVEKLEEVISPAIKKIKETEEENEPDQKSSAPPNILEKIEKQLK